MSVVGGFLLRRAFHHQNEFAALPVCIAHGAMASLTRFDCTTSATIVMIGHRAVEFIA